MSKVGGARAIRTADYTVIRTAASRLRIIKISNTATYCTLHPLGRNMAITASVLSLV